MNNTTRPIGVFDSGLGGLSVLIELKKILPREDFIYLADQKNVPYGEKTKAQLCKIGYDVANYFSKQNVKIIVIACNTSTCYSIDHVRKNFNIPIVGTVPAIKAASKLTRTNYISVISTPATSKSAYLKNLIKQIPSGINVINIGCPKLEEAVEQGDINSKKVHLLLEKYLAKIKRTKADYLVLGCTHYPFLKRAIRSVCPNIKTIDSGQAIAKRTKDVLKELKLVNKSGGSVLYTTTGNSLQFARAASLLLKKRIYSKKTTI
jgi:glutamate racemase